MIAETLSGASFGAIITVFAAGFLSVLTPCVYPLIPITLAVMGATPDSYRAQALSRAGSYVFGMLVTYVALGLIAAQSAALFGSALQSTTVVLVLVGVLLLLAAAILDLISFSVPAGLQKKATQLGGSGIRGAFIMGLFSGVLAAPCVGPVLVVVLGYAASSQDLVWGALLLSVYALGFGLPFFVLAASSSLLARLPKSGNWMVGVKFLLGTSVIMVAISLLETLDHNRGWFEALFRTQTLNIALIIVGLVAGLALTWKNIRLPAACAAAIGAYGLMVWTVPPIEVTRDSNVASIVWHPTLEEGLTIGKERNLLVMVDIVAEWCASCKQLELKTFADATVQPLLKELTLVKLDFTEDSDYSDRISERYQIVGLPCVLFLDSEGIEIPKSRITGYLTPEELIEHLSNLGIEANKDKQALVF